MHFEVSLIVMAPRDKVYSAYTDFESMLRWSRRTTAVAVSNRDGNTVYLERASAGNGRKAVMAMKLFPPERVESERETRFTRTKSVVRFEEAAEGTHVTSSLDVQFKGRWGWVLKTPGRADAEAAAMDELTSFARYVESLL